jgi:signal peptidase I
LWAGLLTVVLAFAFARASINAGQWTLELLTITLLSIVRLDAYLAAPRGRERSLKPILFILIAIFLLSLVNPIIRAFVAEARWIPTTSMNPTLQIEDRVIINKLIYHFHTPKRGDIVVFNPTPVLQTKFKEASIKRIIGIPGDRIELQNQQVVITGQPLVEPYLESVGQTSVQSCFSAGENPFLAQPQIIPADQYLVLGDNRENSFDGRCWGLVPRDYIIGKAINIFWPPARFGDIPTPDYPSIK